MKREEGYYWCKHKGEWQICHWRNGANKAWSFAAYIDDSWWFYDEEFDEIDEKRITRNEPRITYTPHTFTEEEKKENKEWKDLITRDITFDFTYKKPIPEYRNEKGDKLFGLL